LEKVGEKADITMPELAAELAAATCQKVDPASLSRWLIRIGYRFKKTLRASEHDRPEIKQAREEWTSTRKPIMRLEPHRVVFLDETGTTTKMTRLRRRSRKGQRFLSKAPFGHWKTQTFLAGLRCDALIVPFVIDAPMDRLIFETTSSPDLNPIEMAFAKLKALPRARGVRTIDALWRAIGEICDLFSPQECQHYFDAPGYGFT
jgi:hypothetical protein